MLSVVLYVKDYGGLGFSAQQYYPKTGLTFLSQQFGSIGYRHSQVQKCLQTLPTSGYKIFKILFLLNFLLTNKLTDAFSQV